MEFDAFKREFVSHIADMASLDWVLEHARHVCKQLAHEYPHQFGDLPQLVRDELAQRKNPK